MKKNFLVVVLILCTILSNANAQKLFVMGNERLVVPGDLVSSIELVNYDGRNIGWMATYTAFEEGMATFTYIKFEGGKPYQITQQIITQEVAKGLKQDITVAKAFVDPEMITKPKNYWDVSVGFRKENNEVLVVGSTIDVRDGGLRNLYDGTSYLVPFKNKKAADLFATKLKQFLK
jgi:hypothetical protein